MAKTPTSTSQNTIDEDLVRQLADLLDETGLSEIEYGKDGLSIRVAKHAAVAAAPAASTPPPAAALSVAVPAEPEVDTSMADHPGAIASPMVGVVYTASDPGTPPFIQVGDDVSEGQTLFLIEAMKVFNSIVSPRAGKVTHILVSNETPVEFGEPLAIVE